ncbi:DUF2799 domain-containing protein [Rhodobacteraceae bacterium RKSG542]|uniref:DUF2799 domain-containing protein n=1 Tax=Pseudovibrio flavus TaxID=2529854 RepID=UPI0012BCEB60|nr:DUF2799 domain-containing protein [Pseudovibrio flavus]MTI17232.1 DUF2799 domain-containing protein [Pseudovibrio flavus]
MRIFLSVISVVFIGLVVASCASLNKEQCEAGDWKGVGVIDGKEGYASDRLSSHVKACQKYGVTPNTAEYEQGRAIGLQSYCTPISGFEQGQKGAYYRGVCPAASEQQFKLGYNLGKQIYAAQEQLEQARSDLANERADIEREYYESCRNKGDDAFCAPFAGDFHFGLAMERAAVMRSEQNLANVRTAVISQMALIAPGYTPAIHYY